MKGCLLPIAAVSALLTSTGHAQAPAPVSNVTSESLVTAAKRAAGTDYAGTFLRICVAPDNLQGAAGRGVAPARGAAPPGARTVPDRALWYAKPYKVFDNLYFVGTKIHSSWALTTSDGIVLIDTLFDYAIEPEIVDGLKTLGLDPRNIKYVLISHAHGDHDQGAALLQSRYGAKVVMGAADWESTLQRPASAPGGVPKRDVVVGPEGTKITLGDTTVDVIATPGHTPGTLSLHLPGEGQRATRWLSRTPAARRSTFRGGRRTSPSTATASARWRGGGGGRRDGRDDEPHRVRPRVRSRANRAAAARGGREAPVRDRRGNRAALFRDGR